MRKLCWIKKEHVFTKLKTVKLLTYGYSKVGNDAPLPAL